MSNKLKKPEKSIATATKPKKKKKNSKIKEFLLDNPWGTVFIIGLVAFELWALIATIVDHNEIEKSRIPVENYTLAEMDEILTQADTIEYTCFSDYWDCPFTIIVDGKGIGTLTIPIFSEVNITNQAGEVLCTREAEDITLPENIGNVYLLKNQDKPTSYYMSNLDNGFLYDYDKQYLARIEYPDWKNDDYGTNLTAPDGTLLARLDCNVNNHTMTISYRTEDFRLTPEQQMNFIYFYNLKRHEYHEDEYTLRDKDYWIFDDDVQ